MPWKQLQIPKVRVKASLQVKQNNEDKWLLGDNSAFSVTVDDNNTEKKTIQM